jgi:hypothetical protein
MANSNKVSGLTPVKYLSGAPYTGAGNMYHIDSGDGNAYYVGDPVSLKAGTETVSGEAAGLQTLDVGKVGAANVGVILAIGITPRGGAYADFSNLGYGNTVVTGAPATKTKPYFALVADDPMIVFAIQEGGAGTKLTVAATSKNANFALAAPATGVMVSGAYLDDGTAPATTAAYNLKLLGLQQIIDPASGVWNTYGAYAKWLCLLNNHYYGVYGGRTGI